VPEDGHGVYAEAVAMRALGMEVRIAVPERDWAWVVDAYGLDDPLFFSFASESDLLERIHGFDMAIAAHALAVPLVKGLHESRDELVPAYYAQDYEPFRIDDDPERRAEVERCFTAIPEQLMFSNTVWLTELVEHIHGVKMAKVEPSVDDRLFTFNGRRDRNGALRIVAPLSPRDVRSQPLVTLSILDRLRREYSDGVDVRLFGCDLQELEALWGDRGEAFPSLGRLANRGQAADVFKQADVLVDCSVYQPLARTALEAMACGCTAVLPRLGGAREFAVHGWNAMLVDTLNEDSVYRSASQLVERPELVTTLQANGTRTASRYAALRSRGLGIYLASSDG
jgi:glycosyltransferase involved in cell wall biosynthesis